MGATTSLEQELLHEAEATLARICGPHPLPVDDPDWLDSLDNIGYIADEELDPTEIALLLQATCEAWISNNEVSRNVESFFFVLTRTLENVPRDMSAPPDGLLNLLYIARVFLSYCVTHLTTADFNRLWIYNPDYHEDRSESASSASSPSPPAAASPVPASPEIPSGAVPSVGISIGGPDVPLAKIRNRQHLVFRFTQALTDVCTDVARSQHTYALHLEVTQLLITCVIPQARISSSFPVHEEQQEAMSAMDYVNEFLDPFAPCNVFLAALLRIERIDELAQTLLENFMERVPDRGTARIQAQQAAAAVASSAGSALPAADPVPLAPSSSARALVNDAEEGAIIWNTPASRSTLSKGNAAPSGGALSQLPGVGLVRAITSTVSSVFSLPLRLFNFLFPPLSANQPLSDTSAFLFLLLMHQGSDSPSAAASTATFSAFTGYASEHAHDEDSLQPFARAVAALRDEADTGLSHASAGANDSDPEDPAYSLGDSAPLAHTLRFSFVHAYDALVTYMRDEKGILLLYSLLHGNLHFREFVYAKSDVDLLVLPMLEMLYNCGSRGSRGAHKAADDGSDGEAGVVAAPGVQTLDSNQAYMILIVLIILTQDSSFTRTCHSQIQVEKVPWFRESILRDIPLGSLMMVVLLRTLSFNLSQSRDPFCHSNCLASLANLAATCEDMHQYLGQKLTSLLTALAKKYKRLVAHLSFHEQYASNSNGTALPNGDETELEAEETEVATFSEFIRMLLEIFASCLSGHDGRLESNAQLVYWLLLRPQVLDTFEGHAQFSRLVTKLKFIVQHFEAVVSERVAVLKASGDDVIDTVRKHARVWQSSMEAELDEFERAQGAGRQRPRVGVHAAATKFTYEQMDNAEEFFLPYIWNLLPGTLQASLTSTAADAGGRSQRHISLAALPVASVGGDSAGSTDSTAASASPRAPSTTSNPPPDESLVPRYGAENNV